MSLRTLFWPIQRSIEVVKDHRRILQSCNNVTGRLTAQWAKILCLPQFILAPALACLGYPLSGSFFIARIAAMVVVGELDKTVPYQRVLGVCHLVTFGPLFLGLLLTGQWEWTLPLGEKSSWLDLLYASFIWSEMRITALCLSLDARDLILQLMGYRYPCYIREAVRDKKLSIADPDAAIAVSWWSRLVGP